MSIHFVSDWTDLAGSDVEVHRDGSIIRAGQVDSVTSTGNTLWVKAHGINQRRLFDKGEGYCIRLLPHGASQ